MKHTSAGKPQNKDADKKLPINATPQEQKSTHDKKIAPPDEETVKRANRIGNEYIFSAYYKPRKYDLL